MPSTCRRLLVVGFVALLTSALPTQAAEVNKYLPDDTEVIVVVNVKQLVEAPLVKKHALGLITNMIQGDERIKKVLDAVGFDPLKDLSTVTIASSSANVDAKGAVIITGNFDVEKFKAQAEKMAKEKDGMFKQLTEGDHKLLEIINPNDMKSLYATLLDNSTIVAGTDKAFVLECFDRLAGKKTGNLKKEIKTLIEKSSGDASIWLAAPSSLFAKSPLAGDEDSKKTADKIDNVTLSVTVTKDVNMVLAVAAKTADAAKELAEQLKMGLEQAKGFAVAIAGGQKELAPLVEILGAMKVATDGTVITVKSDVTGEMIEKSLKKE